MKRKVAIYARVSTEHKAQINALENQIQYYDNILAQHPEWELVGRYIEATLAQNESKKTSVRVKAGQKVLIQSY